MLVDTLYWQNLLLGMYIATPGWYAPSFNIMNLGYCERLSQFMLTETSGCNDSLISMSTEEGSKVKIMKVQIKW